MKPEARSKTVLKIAQSKAKMYEYAVSPDDHLEIERDPAQLFGLTIGMLGDAAADSCRAAEHSDNEEDRNLQFSARFFNAYIEGHFREGNDAYLLLLASAAFYLSHVPGSALVLARRIPTETPNLEGDGLEILLHWLLLGKCDAFVEIPSSAFADEIVGCSSGLDNYYRGLSEAEVLNASAVALRAAAYAIGTPRQLLLADICAAVILLRVKKSARRCLPLYSDLSPEHWDAPLKKPGFLKELWPSQQLLGEKGIFRGKSAIVQMPTSAGKTRATELIIRSAFMAHRTSLAVVVAPFRALCHEISNAFKFAFRDDNVSVDEMTDVLQPDYDFLLSEGKFELVEGSRVLVVTPEKLLYIVRHQPEIAGSIGLVIYDEGHQFDSGLRGVTYELLLTSLRPRIPPDAQTVLISAVISNASDIGAWLFGEAPTIVSGQTLSPMQRRVAFTSWSDARGQLRFMEEDSLERDDFFVPRVLTQQTLRRSDGKKNGPKFPKKDDSQAIAIYLGLKLVQQGSVAVFCGRKDSATGVCGVLADAYERGLDIPRPLEYSNKPEVEKLAGLYALNLGSNSPSAKAAALGVLSHHGNTPHGIRLAVEFAMREGHAKYVVCTSTLAQGVNLPIRYLIVTSVYQGAEAIKVRDFHNLIGRAGRAGMHVEGTILFADPAIYGSRGGWANGTRWKQTQRLLVPQNSEPVVSSLQTLFEPFKSDDGRSEMTLSLTDLAKYYTQGETALRQALVTFTENHSEFTAKKLVAQAQWRFNVFAAIESYLLAYWEDSSSDDLSKTLAEGTLAYALATDDQKRDLVKLFSILAEHVRTAVPDASRRAQFARTLQGVTTNLEIEKWVTEHFEALKGIESQEELLRYLWPMIASGIDNNTFQRIDRPEVLVDAAMHWINGATFAAILEELIDGEVRLTWGDSKRTLTVDNVVEICETALGYSGSLRIGSINDFLAALAGGDEDGETLRRRLGELQKRLKYGLPATSALALYECGFSDRVVAQHLSNVVGTEPTTRSILIAKVAGSSQAFRHVLEGFPEYFQGALDVLHR